MVESIDSRIGVYIDFDNVVISRYNQLNGTGQFQRDGVRNFGGRVPVPDSAIGERIAAAKVNVDAILDYASSFGTIVVSRAYADWSAPVNADYRNELNGRAIDLTQLFTTTAQLKNGADIRLAVDVVEDLFRLPDLTHIVIVAGDSDYIALAQRCKRLGRYVVGIGVAGATGKYLAAACNEFADYDSLPGVEAPAQESVVEPPTEDEKPPRRSTKRATPEEATTTVGASELFVRAMRLGHAKVDDEWLSAGGVKSQMQRLDPSFNEKSLGFRSFSDFIKTQDSVVETGTGKPAGRIRLRPTAK
jgi:hypothetical protein